MKKSEAMRKYYDAILEAMIDAYDKVIDSRGRVQYTIYIWEDGEIEPLCAPQGDNSYLKPHDWEPRQLYNVTTVAEPFYDPRDQITDPLPEDEAEQEAMLKEADAWMKDEYRSNAADILDREIEQAEFEERFE